MEINKELKDKYENFYSDKTETWRRIGALGKVENILNISKGLDFEKVIDVGAGDGNILELLSQSGFAKEYTAAEISGSAIEQMKTKQIKGLVEIVQFDGYSLPFPDKSFDLAICSHVIEHVEYPRKLLMEIKRISKCQIFEVPIDFSFSVDKKFKHFNAYGHINIYTPALFNFLLLTVGFEIKKRKRALYHKRVIDFQFKGKPQVYLPNMVKRLVWKTIPFLMKNKPNTYTVLTK
jgi:ubiquinone/menaquinone biosynthesis C-methylase UbiE